MDKNIKLIVDTANSTESLEELVKLLEELQGLIQKSEGDNLKELADAFEVVQGKVLSLNKEIKAVDTEVKELKDDLSEPIKLDVNTDKEKIDKLIGSIGDAKKTGTDIRR